VRDGMISDLLHTHTHTHTQDLARRPEEEPEHESVGEPQRMMQVFFFFFVFEMKKNVAHSSVRRGLREKEQDTSGSDTNNPPPGCLFVLSLAGQQRRQRSVRGVGETQSKFTKKSAAAGVGDQNHTYGSAEFAWQKGFRKQQSARRFVRSEQQRDG
jgi:hypothetical protein